MGWIRSEIAGLVGRRWRVGLGIRINLANWVKVFMVKSGNREIGKSGNGAGNSGYPRLWPTGLTVGQGFRGRLKGWTGLDSPGLGGIGLDGRARVPGGGEWWLGGGGFMGFLVFLVLVWQARVDIYGVGSKKS